MALAFSNLAHLIGLGGLVAAIGNVVFVGSAVFTLVVAFLAWRRGNRAAGLVPDRLGDVGDGRHRHGASAYSSTVPRTAERFFITCCRCRWSRPPFSLRWESPTGCASNALRCTEAERRAQTDPLTGVLNRRSLVERLDAACLRRGRADCRSRSLFIDLDHFKEINDSFGHAAGDACLSAVIAPIQAELRQSDVIGRYGGEEFVVILSSADIAAAHPIAERIRNRVADVRIEGFGGADPADV